MEGWITAGRTGVNTTESFRLVEDRGGYDKFRSVFWLWAFCGIYRHVSLSARSLPLFDASLTIRFPSFRDARSSLT